MLATFSHIIHPLSRVRFGFGWSSVQVPKRELVGVWFFTKCVVHSLLEKHGETPQRRHSTAQVAAEMSLNGKH